MDKMSGSELKTENTREQYMGTNLSNQIKMEGRFQYREEQWQLEEDDIA